MILVGGVGQLWQGDLDVGRHAAERLSAELRDTGVVVEDLHYGAVAVAQRLQELTPEALLLVGATRRGRAPGTVEVRRLGHFTVENAAVRAAIAEAVTGYVSIDLVTKVAAGLGALPPDTTSVEIEPAVTGPCDRLSDVAAAALDRAVEIVRGEVAARAPGMSAPREKVGDQNG